MTADDELAGTLAARLDRAAQTRLGRSLALFPLEAGGCGGCALEVGALRASAYRLARLGLSIAATPMQADVLLVTGALTRATAVPVRRAWEAAADPKWVVAIGECAADGGPFRASYAVIGGVSEVAPVDVIVPGCPPDPSDILRALVALLDANA